MLDIYSLIAQRRCTQVSPVVVQEGGCCPIHQSESVLRRLIPLNGINAVRAVVVARDNYGPD